MWMWQKSDCNHLGGFGKNLIVIVWVGLANSYCNHLGGFVKHLIVIVWVGLAKI
jgi:hypothetical protein